MALILVRLDVNRINHAMPELQDKIHRAIVSLTKPDGPQISLNTAGSPPPGLRARRSGRRP